MQESRVSLIEAIAGEFSLNPFIVSNCKFERKPQRILGTAADAMRVRLLFGFYKKILCGRCHARLMTALPGMLLTGVIHGQLYQAVLSEKRNIFAHRCSSRPVHFHAH
jgi:hypothetical protein